MEASDFGNNTRGNQYKTCWKNCRKYYVKGMKKTHSRCPYLFIEKRSCSHCKKPNKYLDVSQTISNQKKLIDEIALTAII
jgi:hypothetical protein